MSTRITQPATFTAAGLVTITLNPNEANNLNGTIDQVEREQLNDLLGARLYNELQTDLLILGTGTATAQKWIDLLDGVTYTKENVTDADVNYYGTTQMLQFFIFFFYVRDFMYKRTSAGVVNFQKENSGLATRGQANTVIEPKYNEAIRQYTAAHLFLKEFEDYSATASGIVESPALTYTVTIADTKYLVVGDTVTIEGNDYVVDTLTTDTDFTFISTAGLTFTNLLVEWKPFEDLATAPKNIIGIL